MAEKKIRKGRVVMTTFEKISEKCPWLHQSYEYEPKVCRAAWACQYNDGNIGGLTGSKFNGWNEMYCSEENCAIYFWLKMERQGIK